MSRTAGPLLMDSPLPDGRLYIPPQEIVGGGTVTTPAGVQVLTVTGGAVTLSAAPIMLLRYGMSDDAQQQFGKGNPSGGFQGAQAQPVTTLTPFTTPYGPSGRPPFPANAFGQIASANGRPKGLKPVAVSVAYTVAGGPLTAFQVLLFKTAFNVGVAPVATTILAATNLPLPNATTQVITTPILAANQNFLADPFDQLVVSLPITAGAGTATIYGVWIDVAFNYN